MKYFTLGIKVLQKKIQCEKVQGNLSLEVKNEIETFLILRKNTKVSKSIRRVRFRKTGAMCPRRRVEIDQEYLNNKETINIFLLPSTNEWCLPASSVIKVEKRKFVIDSGASIHMLSRKDLNSVELESVRTSKSLSAIDTVNDEVQTKEEAIVYVKELDLFVTVKLFEDTSAVLSLGKHCQTNDQESQFIKDVRRIKYSTENYVSIVIPDLSTSSSSSATPASPMSVLHEVSSSYIASRINKKWELEILSMGKSVTWFSRNRKNKYKWKQRLRTGGTRYVIC